MGLESKRQCRRRCDDMMLLGQGRNEELMQGGRTVIPLSVSAAIPDELTALPHLKQT